jgi:hypothetical protein
MGGGIDAADASPTSLLVILWIYTAVPITALDTKESGNIEREVLADARLASSNCPYHPADVTSAGIPLAVWAITWELGEKPLCGRFPQPQRSNSITSLAQFNYEFINVIFPIVIPKNQVIVSLRIYLFL